MWFDEKTIKTINLQKNISYKIYSYKYSTFISTKHVMSYLLVAELFFFHKDHCLQSHPEGRPWLLGVLKCNAYGQTYCHGPLYHENCYHD